MMLIFAKFCEEKVDHSHALQSCNILIKQRPQCCNNVISTSNDIFCLRLLKKVLVTGKQTVSYDIPYQKLHKNNSIVACKIRSGVIRICEYLRFGNENYWYMGACCDNMQTLLSCNAYPQKNRQFRG